MAGSAEAALLLAAIVDPGRDFDAIVVGVFHRRDSTATLAVQVKARMSDSKRVQNEGFVAFVRAQTLAPRRGLDLLFLAVNIVHGVVMRAWLVPSVAFAATVGAPDGRGRYKFQASLKDGTNDRWRPFRLESAELPPAVLARLDALAADR
jgi:hypothetical protein